MSIFYSHYDWLDDNLATFLDNLGHDGKQYKGLIAAHGDKCYGYQQYWEDAGVPFEHGVAIYLLGRIQPYANEIRKQNDGTWVDPMQWVVDNYQRFKRYLPEIDNAGN